MGDPLIIDLIAEIKDAMCETSLVLCAFQLWSSGSIEAELKGEQIKDKNINAI